MKVDTNIFDIIVHALCIILLLSVIIYLFISWSDIPESIVQRFNQNSDYLYIQKEVLFILPAVGIFCYVILTLYERVPDKWNVFIKTNNKNIYKIYRIFKDIIVIFKLFLVALLSFFTYICAREIELPDGFSFVYFGVLIIAAIIFFIRIKKETKTSTK